MDTEGFYCPVAGAVVVFVVEVVATEDVVEAFLFCDFCKLFE